MSDGLNKVMLLGNLGADPELRHTGSGTAVLNIRLACSERFKDRDGQWKDKTEWVNVVVWDKRAEGLAKILRKGSNIFVEGALRTTSYEKDGKKIYKTEVNARNVLLCGGKGEGAQQGGYGAQGTNYGSNIGNGGTQGGGATAASNAFPDDDTVPF